MPSKEADAKSKKVSKKPTKSIKTTKKSEKLADINIIEKKSTIKSSSGVKKVKKTLSKEKQKVVDSPLIKNSKEFSESDKFLN